MNYGDHTDKRVVASLPIEAKLESRYLAVSLIL